MAVSGGSLERWGWDAAWQAKADAWAGGGDPVRVVRHDGVAVLATVASGGEEEVGHLALRRSTDPVTVGDWVMTDGQVVLGALERTSLLRRTDPGDGTEQLLAANAEVVAIVSGLDRPVRPGRLQRAITLAHDSGAVPIAVLNKADLVDDPAAAVEQAREADPGIEIVVVAAEQGEGIEALAGALGDRTAVLLGESGAGKSTLANALCGSEVAATGAVRAGDHKGRHTTTTRQLHRMAAGGWLIDSPGLRAVGLPADEDAVDETFADIIDLGSGCRFRDCAHDVEPGCAVRAAVEGGTLPEERLEAWNRLRREGAAAELQADDAAARAAGRRFSRMAREAAQLKGRE